MKGCSCLFVTMESWGVWLNVLCPMVKIRDKEVLRCPMEI